jgi:hypothetical protein
MHVGSKAFFDDLVAKGASFDIEAWLGTWREQARVYQEQSKRFWLYRCKRPTGCPTAVYCWSLM